jgi:hypothetical protein
MLIWGYSNTKSNTFDTWKAALSLHGAVRSAPKLKTCIPAMKPSVAEWNQKVS